MPTQDFFAATDKYVSLGKPVIFTICNMPSKVLFILVQHLAVAAKNVDLH